MCHSNFYQALSDSCWIPSSICHGKVEFLFTTCLSFPQWNFSRLGNLTTPEDICHVKKFNISSFLCALQLPPNDRLHNSTLLLLQTCNQRTKLIERRNIGRKFCYLLFQTIHQPIQKRHNKRALQDPNRRSEPFPICYSTSPITHKGVLLWAQRQGCHPDYTDLQHNYSCYCYTQLCLC